MTNPAHPNPIQVVQAPGVGEELLDAVKPLLETIQRQRDLEERRQQLALQQQDLKVRQGELQLRQDEYQQNLLHAHNTGSALQAIIGAANAAGPPSGTAAPTLTLPGQPGATGAPPGQDPQSAALGILSGVDPGVVEDVLKIGNIDVGKILTQRSHDIQLNRSIDDAANRLPEAKRADFRAYMALRDAAPEAAGIDKAAPTLFPTLFPKDVTPEQMNAILKYMDAGRGTVNGEPGRNGLISFGMARQLAGIDHKIPGWDDNFTLPKEIKPPSTEAISAMPGYVMMAGAGPKIDAIENAQLDRQKGEPYPRVGLSFPAQVRRSIQQASITGGWGVATGANLVNLIMNTVTSGTLPGMGSVRFSPEDTELMNLTLRFATAVKFALSGKQATLNETLTFLELVSPMVTDDPQTIRDKREFRHAILEGVRLMVSQEPITGDVLDKMVRDAAKIPGGDTGGSMLQDWKAQGDARRAAGEPPEPFMDEAQNQALQQQGATNLIRGQVVVPRGITRPQPGTLLP